MDQVPPPIPPEGLREDTKFTADRIEVIKQALRHGLYLSTALRLADVSMWTYQRWKRQAQQGIEPFASVFREFRKAEAEAEQRLVDIIMQSAEQDGEWRAALELLKRRFPKHWGQQRQEIELTMPDTLASVVAKVFNIEPAQEAEETDDEELVDVDDGDIEDPMAPGD